MPSNQSTSRARSTMLIWIVLIIAVGVAGYFMFFAPKPNETNQVSQGDENAPDFSNVKGIELQAVSLAKTKMAYTLKTPTVTTLPAERQAVETEKLASGGLVPIQEFILEKMENGKKAYGTTFTVYDLKDGLENASLLTIVQERDDVLKAKHETSGELLSQIRVGTPPTLTIETTGDKTATLATLKRSTIVTKGDTESASYEMISGIKIGAKLFAAHFTTDSESKLLAADNQLQDMLSQLQLKTQ